MKHRIEHRTPCAEFVSVYL